MGALRRYPCPLSARQVQAAKRGAVAALSALYSDAPALSSDELLAERERLRIEEDAKRHPQGVLALARERHRQ